MTEQEQKKYLRTKIDVVIIRACQIKETEETIGLKKVKSGDVVNMAHLYADELVAMGKAVVKDSQEHKWWVQSQKEIEESKKAAEKAAKAKEPK